MAAAVVFDLDALLDLGALSELRGRARWAEMKARLGKAVPHSAPGSLSMAELPSWAAESGSRVGIVTDLPGPIAESLLEGFELRCEAIVDASEGFPVGPDPAALSAIAERLGVAAEEMLVLGCSSPRFGAAANLGAPSAGFTGVGRPWNGWRPDIGLGSTDDFLDVIEDGSAMRPVAEVLADGGAPMPHWGSLIALADGTLAAGRHFSSTDRRLCTHQLSKLILRAKEDPAAAERLGQIFGEAVALSKWSDVDVVVAVPGGRDVGFDRFAAARARVAERLGAHDGAGVLEMVRACENYAELDRDRRRMANHGRFKATEPLDGQRAVLIDDVITSGAQTRACARELLAAGASEVRTLVAAATQDPLQRECPCCGGGVMRRVYGRVGPFYACTRYGCAYTEPWDG